MQLTVPGKVPGFDIDIAWTFYGDGDKKSAITDLNHVGDFAARIVADERTLNKWVYVWEDELTQAEAWATAAKVLGPGWLQESKIIKVRSSPFATVTRSSVAHDLIFRFLRTSCCRTPRSIRRNTAKAITPWICTV